MYRLVTDAINQHQTFAAPNCQSQSSKKQENEKEEEEKITNLRLDNRHYTRVRQACRSILSIQQITLTNCEIPMTLVESVCRTGRERKSERATCI